MERTPTLEEYLAQQDKYLKRKYPFFSVRLKPCIVIDPAFLVPESPKPVKVFKEKPIFESKIIRYDISLEDAKKEEMRRRRSNHRPKQMKINKSLVQTLQRGDKIYIDLNTRKTFMKWDHRRRELPMSPASRLQQIIIKEDNDASETIERERRRISEIRTSFSQAAQESKIWKKATIQHSCERRIRTLPDEIFREKQQTIIRNSGLKDPELINLLSARLATVRKAMVY